MANDIARIQLPNGTIVNIRANKLAYGECSTAAGTANKAVTIGTAFVLEIGCSVLVKFANTNTATPDDLTLSINGTTAKPIKYEDNYLTNANILAAGKIFQFVYDGTAWQLVGSLGSSNGGQIVISNGVMSLNSSGQIIDDINAVLEGVL